MNDEKNLLELSRNIKNLCLDYAIKFGQNVKFEINISVDKRDVEIKCTHKI